MKPKYLIAGVILILTIAALNVIVVSTNLARATQLVAGGTVQMIRSIAAEELIASGFEGGTKGSNERKIIAGESQACSGPWLGNWCYAACSEAKPCCNGVIANWLARQQACQSDPEGTKVAIAIACEACNKVCR